MTTNPPLRDGHGTLDQRNDDDDSRMKPQPLASSPTGTADASKHNESPAPRSSPLRSSGEPKGRAIGPSVEYDTPESYRKLDEVAVSGPVQNPDEGPIYRYESLEEARSRDQEYIREEEEEEEEEAAARRAFPGATQEREKPVQGLEVSRLATQIYTVSYLIFFSFFGTLARLGLQWLTDYAGAPVFPSVWFNFGGCVVMGFLSEDRKLFRHEWGTPTYEQQIKKAKEDVESGGSGSDRAAVDLTAAKKAHLATKKTIPLYIGLATGFCGSFTSFSSFIRDAFLAASNDLTYGSTTIAPRNGGYSFMALLAVIIITLADRLAVFLAFGCWVGAILLAAMPPADYWRGAATFALVFAPVGCLARFYASIWLNGLNPAFPVGTFAINVFGTAVLGMGWDLQHVPIGGVIGCQVLQGVEDGFCGCLTTVSTWASELAALRRRHAWTYGGASVVVSFAVMVAIMGGLRWSDGFEALKCVH
ncbi:hypothetical protein VP1G_04265 [Cytospora mali]|uniref:Fluoride export protein 1 n=1 Tax=Cytospora mali TaxID=578113 RepID=A0A194UZ62_CYTMA|nr:hypothetical protein VP1G_04265 [Valsa mali var. pyri (nom. inval.)]